MTLLTTMTVPFITDDVVHRKEIARWMASVQPTIDAMASLSAIASAQPWILATQPPYNAPHDGVTDIVPALSAIAADAGSGGVVIMLPALLGYSYLIDQNYTLPHNVQIRGPKPMNGAPGVGGFLDDYNSVAGRLYVNSAATITMQGNSGVDGLLILRKGFAFPVADSSAFAGTCLHITGDDAFVKHCQIMGFDLAIDSGSAQRPIIADNLLDNRNNLVISACADITKVHNNHAWPFATITGGGGIPGLHRNGVSYRFSNLCDWGKFTDNFSYGYYRGYQLVNVSNCTLLGCGADNTQAFPNSVGIEILGNCSGTQLIGCQTAAQDHGVHISTSTSYSTIVTSFSAWGNVVDGMRVDKGRVSITNSWFRDDPNGLTCNYGANGYVSVSDCYFENQTVRPIQCNVSTSLLSVTNIRVSPNVPIISANQLSQQISVSATLMPVISANEMHDLLGSGTVEAVLGMWPGREVTFTVNANSVIFKHSFNQFGIVLAGAVNFTASNAAMISFMCNGTLWIEKSRKL